MDTQRYRDFFLHDIIQILLLARQSENGTMTTVPDTVMPIGEETVALKLVMQKKRGKVFVQNKSKDLAAY